MKPMNPDIIIDFLGGITETAAALGVSKQAVWNWRKRGAIPALRIYQFDELFQNRKFKEEMEEVVQELKKAERLPQCVGRKPSLTREQLLEIHQVTGSARAAKYGTIPMLAQKFGVRRSVITRARKKGFKHFDQEDKMKSASCA